MSLEHKYKVKKYRDVDLRYPKGLSTKLGKCDVI